MKIEDFEDAVRDIEGVTIIVRAPENEEVGDYDYKRKMPENKSITQWKRNRLDNILTGFEYVIMDGDHETPNGRTLMATLRNSYEQLNH